MHAWATQPCFSPSGVSHTVALLTTFDTPWSRSCSLHTRPSFSLPFTTCGHTLDQQMPTFTMQSTSYMHWVSRVLCSTAPGPGVASAGNIHAAQRCHCRRRRILRASMLMINSYMGPRLSGSFCCDRDRSVVYQGCIDGIQVSGVGAHRCVRTQASRAVLVSSTC